MKSANSEMKNVKVTMDKSTEHYIKIRAVKMKAKNRGTNVFDRGIEIIDSTPQNIENYAVCGYKNAGKHVELGRKIDWFKEYYPKGLRIKALMSEAGGYQGMLEYIPGKYAHSPVEAEEYMFIHFLFVGFRNEFKGNGYATLLIKPDTDRRYPYPTTWT
jgi:hypothetical protein